MKVAVLGGGGAMGGMFGGWLARAGHEVTLVDVSLPAVEAINREGLAIEEKDGSVSNIAVHATSRPDAVGAVDLILNFVKCYNTEAAVRSALPMLGEDTAVLSLQNGWGNADRIAEVAGRQRVMVGLTYHSGTLVGPGRIKHPGSGMTYVGELDGRASPRLSAAVGALRSAGLEVTESPRIIEEVWKKLALNVCTLPTAALLGFFANELNQFDGTRLVMRGLLAEVGAVARAQGIGLDEDERWAAITGLLDRAVGAKGSMMQDVEGRRPTEIDVINGAIVAAGREHGIPTPVNDTMVALIKSLQDRYLAAQAN